MVLTACESEHRAFTVTTMIEVCRIRLDMKQLFLLFTVAMLLAGCEGHSGNKSGAEDDSVSTAPVTDPSYNPKVEADSAAKQMNLDSTLGKDSAGRN